jgi:hypothetical protein
MVVESDVSKTIVIKSRGGKVIIVLVTAVDMCVPWMGVVIPHEDHPFTAPHMEVVSDAQLIHVKMVQNYQQTTARGMVVVEDVNIQNA